MLLHRTSEHVGNRVPQWRRAHDGQCDACAECLAESAGTAAKLVMAALCGECKPCAECFPGASAAGAAVAEAVVHAQNPLKGVGLYSYGICI